MIRLTSILSIVVVSCLLCSAAGATGQPQVDSPREKLSESILRYIPEGPADVPAEEWEAAYRDRINALVIGDGDGEGVELNDAQVEAMLHALHNTHKNGLVPVVAPEDLEKIIAGDYGTRAVRAAVQGFEKRGRFTEKATRFDPDSEQAQRALDKATAEHDKFTANAERHNAEAQARDLAKDQARELARHEGRTLGRSQVEHAAGGKLEKANRDKARGKSKNN